jgi:hypothetical protein
MILAARNESILVRNNVTALFPDLHFNRTGHALGLPMSVNVKSHFSIKSENLFSKTAARVEEILFYYLIKKRFIPEVYGVCI